VSSVPATTGKALAVGVVLLLLGEPRSVGLYWKEEEEEEEEEEDPFLARGSAGGQKGHLGVEMSRNRTKMCAQGRGRKVIAWVGGGEKMPLLLLRWRGERMQRRFVA
jgi:hypothetical protein